MLIIDKNTMTMITITVITITRSSSYALRLLKRRGTYRNLVYVRCIVMFRPTQVLPLAGALRQIE